MVLKYHIQTYGCQMNVADSREYRISLEAYGFQKAEEPFDADLVIVNTCSVRAKPEDKLVSFLGACQAAREQNPRLKVGLVGCTATLRGSELQRRFPVVGFTLPATDIEGFTERLLATFPALSPFETEAGGSIDKKERFERFVTIMRGCESYCSYCVVPYARGEVRSLPPGEILRRCDDAVAGGCRILTLLGQNVMAYGRNPVDDSDTPGSFPELLRVVARRYPECWIKFLTSHPADVTTALVDFIGETSNISMHFHLPIQSGDDNVLRDMNRGYTSDEYRRMVKYIREKLPESRISTDVIVGFPSEDETAFANTLKLARELRFDQMFTFQYSSREGTAAHRWEDPVTFEEKRRRLAELIEVQNEIVREKHRALVGKRMTALITGASREGSAATTRESHIIVVADADVKPGTVVEVEITEGMQRTLKGKVV